MSGLKPCPLCGGTDSEDNVIQEAMVILVHRTNAMGRAYRIECNCGCKGPWENDHTEARDLWNDRPDLAALQAERDRLREALFAADDHIQIMQHQCTQYLEPSGYTSFDRKRIAFEKDREAKDSLFMNDMIYLLDGPEQRAVQEAIRSALNHHEGEKG